MRGLVYFTSTTFKILPKRRWTAGKHYYVVREKIKEEHGTLQCFCIFILRFFLIFKFRCSASIRLRGVTSRFADIALEAVLRLLQKIVPRSRWMAQFLVPIVYIFFGIVSVEGPFSTPSAHHEPCKHLPRVSANSLAPVAQANLPKVILLDTGNGVHSSYLCSGTDQLDPNVRANLNDRIFIVGELRRRRVWIESDVRRNKLLKLLAQLSSSSTDLHLHVQKQREEVGPHRRRSRLG